MSKLLEFTNFLKDKEYAIDELKRFHEIIEPLKQISSGDPFPGYRLKPLKPADHNRYI